MQGQVNLAALFSSNDLKWIAICTLVVGPTVLLVALAWRHWISGPVERAKHREPTADELRFEEALQTRGLDLEQTSSSWSRAWIVRAGNHDLRVQYGDGAVEVELEIAPETEPGPEYVTWSRSGLELRIDTADGEVDMALVTEHQPAVDRLAPTGVTEVAIYWPYVSFERLEPRPDDAARWFATNLDTLVAFAAEVGDVERRRRVATDTTTAAEATDSASRGPFI